VGGAFLQEGFDAFASVAVAQVLHKMMALTAQLFAQGVGLGFVDEFFDAGHDVGRALVQLFGQLQRCGKCRTRRSQLVDESQGVQLGGWNALAEHQQSGDERAGQGARQGPTATAIGRQRHAAVGHQKDGVVGSHHEVTGQGQ